MVMMMIMMMMVVVYSACPDIPPPPPLPNSLNPITPTQIKTFRKLVQLCGSLRVPDPMEVPPMQLNERSIMSFLEVSEEGVMRRRI